MQKNKLLVLLATLFCFVQAKSQNFDFRAPIHTVTQDGFYSFWTTPFISSNCAIDLHDLRIRDAKGTWIPHFIRPILHTVNQQTWRALPIHSNRLVDSGNTELIIVNETKNALPQLCLLTGQTNVIRSGKLSGGNDLQHWYVITDQLDLYQQYRSNSKDSMYMHVGACPGGYKYYRLLIQNGGYDPLPIKGAGLVEGAVFTAAKVAPALELACTQLSKKDSSDGYSYYYLQPEIAAAVDQIKIVVQSPKFFNRNSTLYAVVKNKAGIDYLNSLIDFQLRAIADTIQIQFPKTMAKQFLLRISNGDNPPLVLRQIRVLYQPQELVCYLEKAQQYEICFGNANAPSPVYDLSIFADSVAALLPAFTIGSITKEKADVIVAEPKRDWNSWITWSAIILSMILLGWLSIKMIGERNEK